jgi:hypothetical protein
LHADGAHYKRINTYFENGTYNCDSYALEELCTDRSVLSISNRLDAPMAIVKNLVNKLHLGAEVLAMNLLFNTTTFTGTDLYKDYSGTPWSTTSTDVISQIAYAIEAVSNNTGVAPNTLIISEKAYAQLRSNDALRSSFNLVNVTKDVFDSQLAGILGINKILVSGARINTSPEGIAYSGAPIWSHHYAMVCTTANADDPFSVPCIGRTFVWDMVASDVPRVEQYRDEQTKGWVYRAEMFEQAQIIDPYFGMLLKVNAS